MTVYSEGPDRYEFESLRSDVDKTRRDVEEIRDGLDGLSYNKPWETDVQEVADGAEAAAAAVERLRRRLEWVERRLRRSEGIEPCDLDAVDEPTRELAGTALKGREAAQQMLTGYTREIHRKRLAEYQQHEDEALAQRAAVVDGARRLATTEYGTQAHTLAAEEYRAARAALHQAADAIARIERRADEARTALAHDEQIRESGAEALVSAGEEAARQLRERLRCRLYEAISAGELLPTWFTSVLGDRPGRRGHEWVTTAVELLAYRVTYGITDPVVALDQATGAGYSERDHWRDQITKDLQHNGI
jgi:hypothetical protein